eukprot:TRINITY_DN19274_c1_g1_i5.p1 TRINITY_DN19274_c1_g1~~TRINITY_DN19274_c1_g1_i5.p1  ORF type:complete len:426 (+),score=49.80 TRINITY_DN19274_c1_g1_i5:135-1412(+)
MTRRGYNEIFAGCIVLIVYLLSFSTVYAGSNSKFKKRHQRASLNDQLHKIAKINESDLQSSNDHLIVSKTPSIQVASNYFGTWNATQEQKVTTSTNEDQIKKTSFEKNQIESLHNLPLVSEAFAQSDVMGYFRSRFETRGAWFDVQDWAAASNMCQGNATTTACMSCSMNMPHFALQQKVAAFGVSDLLWAFPEAGITCGMCLKILLPNADELKDCDESTIKSDPNCKGTGNAPYLTNSVQPWAWNSPLYSDDESGMKYIIGIVVEWYDLYVPLPYGISYLTKGKEPHGMGSWPVQVTAIECPVQQNGMEYAFIDFGDISQNRYNKKLQIAGHSMPIVSVEIKLGGQWYTMRRSGKKDDGGYPDSDGHWMSPPATPHDLNVPLDLRILCANSSQPVVETGLVPAEMMCKYQDPQCTRHMGTAQCI